MVKQHARPLFGEVAHDVPELAPGLGVEPCSRFVEENELRVTDYAQGYVKAPTLPARERPDAGAAFRREADPLDDLFRLSRIRVKVGEMVNAFRHRQVGDIVARLKDDTPAGPPCRPGALRVLAQDPGLAGVAPSVALEYFDGGGLACPVRAEERQDLATLHLQVQPVHRNGAPIGLTQSPDLDHKFASHGPSITHPAGDSPNRPGGLFLHRTVGPPLSAALLLP